MMNNRLLLILALAFVLALTVFEPVFAYTYDIVFGGWGPGGGTTFRGPNASTYAVTSAWNQPRSVGTNPHQGVDLAAPYGTDIYPVYNGWISYISTYTIRVQLDINANKVRDDSLYVTYYHCSKTNYYSVGTYVTTSNIIGKSGDEGGAYAPHLHFGMGQDTDSDGSPEIWIKNEIYYRGTAAWNYGKDLDFIKAAVNANTAQVTAYATSDGTKVPISAGHAIIYTRTVTGSAWTSHTMTKSGDNFSFNLASIYPVGTNVQWMVRVQRSDLSTSVYRWGFDIPKYSQPDPDPNANAYSYAYYTRTIQ